MKKGVIIIFGKNDIEIENTLNFRSFFNHNIRVCLVNNGNHEKVFKLLYKLKESSNCDVSILNLRTEKSQNHAVKAGVRFLNNKENIHLIIHSQPINICNQKIIEKLLNIFNQELIKKKDERVLLRRVYSINEVFNYKVK